MNRNRSWSVIRTVLVAGCLAAPALAAPPGPEGERELAVKPRAGSYLGVGVAEIDTERAKALSLREERGVEITRMEEEGPAAKAGLKVGDVVLEFNGQRVEGTEQLMRLVRETPAGREVKLVVSRGGASQTLALRTGARKGFTARGGDGLQFEIPKFETRTFEVPEFRMPDVPKAHMGWQSPALGIEGESVDSQLAQFFGVKQGVLVRSVLQGTPAEKAGLRAGDVILKVDDTAVSSPREISAALRAALGDGRKSVVVALMRERKETTLSITLAEERAERVLQPPAAAVAALLVTGSARH